MARSLASVVKVTSFFLFVVYLSIPSLMLRKIYFASAPMKILRFFMLVNKWFNELTISRKISAMEIN